jgi:hypothetical protein
MQRAEGLLVNGILALALSLGIWELTGSFAGWLVLAAPGSALVIWGWVRALRDF